jgi:hypothetical protein
MELYNCGKLIVKTSTIPNSGFGVFATEDIKTGEILEECPYIPFIMEDGSKLFEDYRFYVNKEKKEVAIVLGYGSMFNSLPEKRNSMWVPPFTPKNILFENKTIQLTREYIDCFTFFAVRDIKKGDEIFLNYHGSSFREKK